MGGKDGREGRPRPPTWIGGVSFLGSGSLGLLQGLDRVLVEVDRGKRRGGMEGGLAGSTYTARSPCRVVQIGRMEDNT